MPEKIENVLPALNEAPPADQDRVDAELDEMARRKEAAKQQAQDEYLKKEARKNADHQQEWMLRQKEKRKDVLVLPDAHVLLDRIKEAQPMIQAISHEIKESDIRVVLPFHPGYSLDLTMARTYNLDKEGEKGPDVEFVELFDELANNYAEAMARFRALNWFPDEDLVFNASHETNDLRHDNKDDLEDLVAIMNHVTPPQPFFVWFQDFKRDIDNVYFMRTGTETLLRQWFRTKKDREVFVEGVEEGEPRRKKLFEMVEKSFIEQGVAVPDAYRYKTLEEADVRDRFGFMDFGEKEEVKKVDEKKVDEKKVDENKVDEGKEMKVGAAGEPADKGEPQAK